jgi:hypothetical protein
MGNPRTLVGRCWCLVLTVALLAGCGARAHDAPAEAPAMHASPASAPSDPSEDGYSVTQNKSAGVTVASAESLEGDDSPREDAAAPAPPARAPGGLPANQLAAPSPPAGPTSASIARAENRAPLLIYAATLNMAVFGVEAALDAVEKLARDRKGYLVRRADTAITIRVPAAVFDETLNGVGSLGDELHREVVARDVTEEYADLEVRLKNAEAVRQRLETLLAKASNVEDALAVERELGRVAESIEQLKGRMKLLGELVAFSTITVNFQARSGEPLKRETPLPFEWLRELGLSNLLSL